MDPQWNMFQPPISSEPAVLDYNRPLNSTSHPHHNNTAVDMTNNQQSQPRYNGFYDPAPPPPPHSTTQSHQHLTSRAGPPPMPTSPCYTNAPHQIYPPISGPQTQRPPPMPQQQSQPPPRDPQINTSQSNYYSNSTLQYPPPITDFKIDTFTLNPNGFPNESNVPETNNSSYNSQSNGSYSQTNNSYNSQGSSSPNNQSTRETGIIEKLLQTYGFIQCCERQARLFFHFTQFDGNTDHLRIGDPVEFEVTFDRRTGKPIASAVAKISPEAIAQVLSEERVIGEVTTELASKNGGEQTGRISYENRGECFFLPYGKEDVEGYVVLKPGDKVSFQISTNQRTGNLAARHVRLENPTEPVKYQGVVSTIKDSYGFIERADVVDEIFFHFSEAKHITGGLKLGDDVEFTIQSRLSKEVATNMEKLDSGTVVFEDVSTDVMRGQVLKPVDRNLRHNQKDPLTGRIRYRAKDRSEVEVKFGERDMKGEFTLRHGDWVQFNIATDRRDHLQKATNISLLDESFNVSGEKRDRGVVVVLKDLFGFIKCTDKDLKVFFHYNELLEPQYEISLDDEVEFTIAPDQTDLSPTHQCAIRIHKLPAGSVLFEVKMMEHVEGHVIKTSAGIPRMPTKSLRYWSVATNEKPGEPGQVQYLMGDEKNVVNYYAADLTITLQLGDKIGFSLYQVKRTKEFIVLDVLVLVEPLPVIMDSTDIETTANNIITTTTTTTTTTTPPPSPETVPILTSISNTTTPASNIITNGNINNHNNVNNNNSNNNNNNNNNNTSEPRNSVRNSPIVLERANGGNGPNSNGNYHNESRQQQKKQQQPLPKHQGYVAALKDTFGFIETSGHDREIFFHFSNVDGDAGDLELGNEVEYTLSSRTGPGGKVSAENVHGLITGTMDEPKILGEVFEGVVLRSMRSVNPDQQEYCGLICIGTEGESKGRHQFGITGVVNKRELLQPSDQITFQLNENLWAVNIRAIRKKLIATVDAVKGVYGFLNYETDEGKKLFFHESEVRDGVNLIPGDEVEFVIITNQKTGKSSACNIARILATSAAVVKQRPERLVHKLKSTENFINRMPVIRQPRGPDGTKGFKFPRSSSVIFTTALEAAVEA